MTAPKARVRLTDDAVDDLKRLAKRDPEIARLIFRRMLLLERSPNAGEPLLGSLVGFRKLSAGDCKYRIVWRETSDPDFEPVLEIAEVWAAGVRTDGEVYDEIRSRVEKMGRSSNPRTRALADVLARMGSGFAAISAHKKPAPAPALPSWLAQALQDQLGMSPSEMGTLTEAQAQQLLVEHWSRPGR